MIGFGSIFREYFLYFILYNDQILIYLVYKHRRYGNQATRFQALSSAACQLSFLEGKGHYEGFLSFKCMDEKVINGYVPQNGNLYWLGIKILMKLLKSIITKR
jgi:hypothetical protein